jgi:hypothetical protein
LQLSAHTSQLRQWSCSGKPLVRPPFSNACRFWASSSLITAFAVLPNMPRCLTYRIFAGILIVARRSVGCGRTRRERLFFSLSSHGFPLFVFPFRTSRSLDSTATPAPLSHDPNCVDLRITALSPGKIDPSFQIRAPPNPISTGASPWVDLVAIIR